MIPAKRFNEDGLSRCRELHNSEKGISDLPVFPLIESSLTEPVLAADGSPVMVPESPTLSTRRDVVNCVLGCIKDKMSVDEFLDDYGLQAWMACLWHEILRRKGGSVEGWHGFETARLMPSDHYTDFYRHCIGGLIMIHHTHGGKGLDFIMDGVATARSDILEQLASVPHLMTSGTFIGAANKLYHDPKALYTGSQKDLVGLPQGFVRGSGGNGAGSARRLVVAYWQYYETYDPDSMTVDEFFDFLPDEFNRFKGEKK